MPILGYMADRRRKVRLYAEQHISSQCCAGVGYLHTCMQEAVLFATRAVPASNSVTLLTFELAASHIHAVNAQYAWVLSEAIIQCYNIYLRVSILICHSLSSNRARGLWPDQKRHICVNSFSNLYWSVTFTRSFIVLRLIDSSSLLSELSTGTYHESGLRPCDTLTAIQPIILRAKRQHMRPSLDLKRSAVKSTAEST